MRLYISEPTISSLQFIIDTIFSSNLGQYKLYHCYKVKYQIHSCEMSSATEVDEEAATTESSSAAVLADSVSQTGEAILEPYEGLEFESEEAAKVFYDEYARRMGFVMRVMGCRKSEVDGRILARRLGCNKEGYCLSVRGKTDSAKKRQSTREGCKAMILVKADKSGKWTVTKFLKEHNHPLVVSLREIRQSMDIRDRKIQELNSEIRIKKRLCSIYQDQLAAFMKEVEEHGNQLSKKVQTVVKNLKDFGPIEDDLLQHR